VPVRTSPNPPLPEMWVLSSRFDESMNQCSSNPCATMSTSLLQTWEESLSTLCMTWSRLLTPTMGSPSGSDPEADGTRVFALAEGAEARGDWLTCSAELWRGGGDSFECCRCRRLMKQ